MEERRSDFGILSHRLLFAFAVNVLYRGDYFFILLFCEVYVQICCFVEILKLIDI
jgi:hypothetical protein